MQPMNTHTISNTLMISAILAEWRNPSNPSFTKVVSYAASLPTICLFLLRKHPLIQHNCSLSFCAKLLKKTNDSRHYGAGACRVSTAQTPPELSTYACDVHNTLRTTDHTTEPNPSPVQPLSQVVEFLKTFLRLHPNLNSQFTPNAHNKSVTICSTDIGKLIAK